MDQLHFQLMCDGGKLFNPINIQVPIQSTTDAAGVTHYLKLPFGARLMGARVRAFGTLGGTVAVTIKQGYVSAGDADDMDDYGEPMTAAQLTAAGITVTATDNPDLLTCSPAAVNTLYEAAADADFLSSGSGNYARSGAVLEEDDVLIIHVAQTTTNTPVYHVDIMMAPNE